MSGNRPLAALAEHVIKRLGHQRLQRGVLLQRDHMELARYFRREPSGDLTATHSDRARDRKLALSACGSRSVSTAAALPPTANDNAALSAGSFMLATPHHVCLSTCRHVEPSAQIGPQLADLASGAASGSTSPAVLPSISACPNTARCRTTAGLASMP